MLKTTLFWIMVTVSAYNPLSNQTDSTPLITASNKRVQEGFCAVSRDLEEQLKLKFGDLIHLDGIGTCEFQDRMSRRKKLQIDLFMWEEKDAIKFGIKRAWMRVERR